MITLRRNTRRRRVQRGKQDIQLSFYPQEHPGPLTDDFGILSAFDEIRLPPSGVSGLLPLEGAEIVTYVYRGALAQESSNGSSRVVHAGEFQRMTIGRGSRHKETNALRTDFTHMFRITLRPTEVGFDSAHEQKRFAVGQRHNLMCVIASQDGRKKSLSILQDALIYSSILDIGHHIAHELSPGRSAWLHVINGEVAMQDIILTEGDGAGIAIEPSVSLTARENTEILLVDLGPAPRSFV
ncbi:MAG: pirin family protein [Proteobacteria bacterium]|nr:pirin family protein [Pseudomonadota bacterium]